jgi:hypothetical protein
LESNKLLQTYGSYKLGLSSVPHGQWRYQQVLCILGAYLAAIAQPGSLAAKPHSLHNIALSMAAALTITITENLHEAHGLMIN